MVIAKPHLSVKKGSCGHSKGLSRVSRTARVVIAKASLECQEGALLFHTSEFPLTVAMNREVVSKVLQYHLHDYLQYH